MTLRAEAGFGGTHRAFGAIGDDKPVVDELTTRASPRPSPAWWPRRPMDALP
jgi:hypothetical protein